MIEKFDIGFFVELADHSQAVSALWPADRDQRLRLLEGCLILRERDAFAVFRNDLLQQWRTVIFDIDQGPTNFVIGALNFLFDKMEARDLRLTSKSREAGVPLRAVFVGPTMRPNMDNNPEFVWSLTLEDWSAAGVLLRQALPKPEKVKYCERWKAA